MYSRFGAIIVFAVVLTGVVPGTGHASQEHVQLCNRSGATVTPIWFLTNSESTGASAPRLAQGGGKALANGKCDSTTAMPASKTQLYIVMSFKTASGGHTPTQSYPLANPIVNVQRTCSTEMDDASPVCIRPPKPG